MIVNEPTKFAYNLREAFSVIKRFRSQYPRYADVVDNFTFRVNGKTVVAVLRNPMTAQHIASARVTISNAVSAMEIVGAALMHKASAMHFPNASMNPEEVSKVKRWATVSGYVVEPSTSNDGLYLTHK